MARFLISLEDDIMPQDIMPQSEKYLFQCRLTNASPKEKSSAAHFDFCAFAFPRCNGCPHAAGAIYVFQAIDDPMKSKLWNNWLGGLRKPA
jgi:hypothetical protein